MTRIAGLASNRGRNLVHVADEQPGGAELAVVLSNHADAPVLNAATERGIATEVIEREDGEDREVHERRVLDRLAEHDADLVCLDGYMRVLTPAFLDSAPPTLNVHPSLLPAFPGMDAHEQVIEAGVRVSGCTIHLATEAVDEGPIVTQEPVPVYPDDDADALKDRVLHEAEFAAYPRAIRWFAEGSLEIIDAETGPAVHVDADEGGAFPTRRVQGSDRVATLRYGENPHQEAAVYADRGRRTGSDATSGDGASGDASGNRAASVVDADQLNPDARALSYNNYNDADGALALVREFDRPAAAVIKHTNPAGCATADTLSTAYTDALATDPMSAYGGIVALNRECDEATAAEVIDSFKEVVVAPGYTDAALDTLAEKESLRVLDVGNLGAADGAGETARADRYTEKHLVGGRLVQERDQQKLAREDLEVVTEREPTEDQVETMLFAWQVLKHVKSNGILFADGTETVGVGMGQVSRVDAVRLAAMKADEHAEGKSAAGGVMASDAFFPFPDGVEAAAEAGIEAVVQPGGSKRDEQVTAAADDLGVAMVHTGRRCFRHD